MQTRIQELLPISGEGPIAAALEEMSAKVNEIARILNSVQPRESSTIKLVRTQNGFVIVPVSARPVKATTVKSGPARYA